MNAQKVHGMLRMAWMKLPGLHIGPPAWISGNCRRDSHHRKLPAPPACAGCTQ